MRQKLLVVGAIVFGLIAMFLTHRQINLERQRALKGLKKVRLIQVIESLSEGGTINEDSIRMVEVKRSGGRNLFYDEIPWSEKSSVIGEKVAVPLMRGKILRWGDLKGYGAFRKELADQIPMQWRGVSIPVDNVSSVAGLVRPNDRVDILGTFRFPSRSGDEAFDTLTLTILQNVVILATGSETKYNRRSDKRSRGYGSVTLALTPKEAEMIVFASQKGILTLTLRNRRETEIEDDLQSVDFKFLEDNIEKYNRERKRIMQNYRD